MSAESLLVYLEDHPLAALALAVLGVLVLGSLLRKLVKLAMFLAIALIVGLYWTHREAKADWRVQAEVLRRRAAELGQEAVETGKEILREGKEELEKERRKEER
ncbi:MAG: hypothetical protein AB1505_17065 [Candidatus Latescibacterota bacterium]